MRSTFVLFISLAVSVLAQQRVCTLDDYAPVDAKRCFDCPAGGDKRGVAEHPELFRCHFEKSDRYSDGSYAPPDVTDCTYDASGTLTKAESRVRKCEEKLERKAGCAPDKKPDCKDQYYRCSGDNCKTQTDQCFTCPHFDANPFVEVSIEGKTMTCNYRTAKHPGLITKCSYDSNSGESYSGPEGPCTTRATIVDGCTPKVPKPATEELPYYSCVKPPNSCRSKYCWTCPEYPESDSVFVSANVRDDRFLCHYTNADKGGPICYYDPRSGSLLENDGNGQPLSAPECTKIPQARKDNSCKSA